MEKIIILFSFGFLFLSQSMATIKYPPCDQGCDCTGNGCKQPGDPTPYEWPELIELKINIYLGINGNS
ncbi:hypothetical protein MTR67_037153 [Solanum verrucosum]|uniref:Uncharacterized protein n=1 Tax=Solanum verrucosum TaxID=315347 RepID=A0AAF0UDD3_SOLVR|nr:hypothetical protein MTR67_037153 [Solanum verrucosum]